MDGAPDNQAPFFLWVEHFAICFGQKSVGRFESLTFSCITYLSMQTAMPIPLRYRVLQDPLRVSFLHFM